MQFSAFKLDETQAAIDKFNWFLGNGWGVVDRFELDNAVILMMKHD